MYRRQTEAAVRISALAAFNMHRKCHRYFKKHILLADTYKHLMLKKMLIFCQHYWRLNICDNFGSNIVTLSIFCYDCELTHFQTFKAKTAWQSGKTVCRHFHSKETATLLKKKIQETAESSLEDIMDGRGMSSVSTKSGSACVRETGCKGAIRPMTPAQAAVQGRRSHSMINLTALDWKLLNAIATVWKLQERPRSSPNWALTTANSLLDKSTEVLFRNLLPTSLPFVCQCFKAKRCAQCCTITQTIPHHVTELIRCSSHVK